MSEFQLISWNVQEWNNVLRFIMGCGWELRFETISLFLFQVPMRRSHVLFWCWLFCFFFCLVMEIICCLHIWQGLVNVLFGGFVSHHLQTSVGYYIPNSRVIQGDVKHWDTVPTPVLGMRLSSWKAVATASLVAPGCPTAWYWIMVRALHWPWRCQL